MTGYFQTIVGILVAVILGLAISKQGRDITLLLGICVCCMVLWVAVGYLEPVLDLVARLRQLSQMDTSLLSVVIKAVGIGLVAEIAALICSDSGNAALGKAVQILASSAVLWLSVPLMNSLVDLLQKIVGEL